MKQQLLIFRTWGGKRKGAGRKRHTDELPHLARPEVRTGQPQHVTIRVRPDVISLRKSKSFAVIKPSGWHESGLACACAIFRFSVTTSTLWSRPGIELHSLGQ